MPQELDDLALQNAIAKIKSICEQSGGRSQLFPFGGGGYNASVTNYFGNNTAVSRCAVQPGSAEDLREIVKVIAETRVPFAVKNGGRASNPGFSSTKGIQIYLVRFNRITVRAEEGCVDVGAGCLFGELYAALAPYNLNIVGGFGIAGVGVSGWLLGGGYSVKTSQFGLGIDNIESAKLVLPDGSLKEVSATQNEDLFFAIKGGGNNFGIVTEFTLKTHKQDETYYNFQLTYEEEHIDAVKGAVVNFINASEEDPKANLEAIFGCHRTPDGIQRLISVHCVYDGSFLVDPFKELAAIDHTIENYGSPYPPPLRVQADEPIASTKTGGFYAADTLRSWVRETYDLIELPGELQESEAPEVQFNVLMSGRTLPITEFVGDGTLRRTSPRYQPPKRPMVGNSQFPRGRWGTVPVDRFTPEIIAIMQEEHQRVSAKIAENGGRRVDISLWHFAASMYDHATPSALPHQKGEPNCPVIVWFTWEGEENDAFWVDALRGTLDRLRGAIGNPPGSRVPLPHFVNAALAGWSTVEDLYRENLPKLGSIRAKYDPHAVMDLAGGFKIPLVRPLEGQQAEQAA